MRRFKLNFEYGLGKGVPVSFSPPTTFLSEDFVSSKFLSLIVSEKLWAERRRQAPLYPNLTQNLVKTPHLRLPSYNDQMFKSLQTKLSARS